MLQQASTSGAQLTLSLTNASRTVIGHRDGSQAMMKWLTCPARVGSWALPKTEPDFLGSPVAVF